MSASGCVWKMLSQGGLELDDLAVQLGDDAHRGAGGGPERGGDWGRCGQLLRPQRGLHLAGARGDVALAPPRLSADWMALRGRCAPCSGVGARLRTPRASPWAKSSKAASAAG